MDTCTCMAESLCYSPETITTLLIGYSPIQNKKFKKKDIKRKKVTSLIYQRDVFWGGIFCSPSGTVGDLWKGLYKMLQSLYNASDNVA